MRFLPVAALAALTLAVAFDASAQSASTPHRNVFGYQDLETGEFHPIPHVRPETTTPPITGKYELTFVVTLEDALPAGATVSCSATIIEITQIQTTVTTPPSVTYSSVDYSELGSGTVAASTTAGSKVNCTVPISYSWNIPAASHTSTTTVVVKSTVAGSYSVTAYPAATSTVSELVLRPIRTSSSDLAIPATVATNGTTTNLTVDATL